MEMKTAVTQTFCFYCGKSLDFQVMEDGNSSRIINCQNCLARYHFQFNDGKMFLIRIVNPGKNTVGNKSVGSEAVRLKA